MPNHLLAVVLLTAKEGREGDLEALLVEMHGSAVGDAGTVQHSVCRHEKDSRRFVMVEQFADEAAFALHRANDTLNTLGAKLGDMIEDMQLVRTRPIVG